MKIKLLILALIVGMYSVSIQANPNYSDIRKKINAVENGLKKGIQLKGHDEPGMYIYDRMKFYKVPAVSIAVINNGNIEWAKTYNIYPNETITTHTLFQAASISKPVSAATMLYVAETNNINLDENVNDLLKSWTVAENQYTANEKVTLRRLLSHTAGLTVHGFDGYSSSSNVIPTLKQILNGEPPANSAPVVVEQIPGKEFLYSGGGYEVAQLLIEDVTKKKLSDLAREIIFNPLEMKESTYDLLWPNQNARSIAKGHLLTGSIIPGNWHLYPESAAAGLWTTPSDLARFAIEIENAYAGEGNKILSQALVQQMLTSQSSKHYGFGFGVKEIGVGVIEFKHSGGNDGFRCHLVGLTGQNLGVVIMTNSDNGLMLVPEIVRSIADAYHWPTGYSDQAKILEPVGIDPAIYKNHVGEYIIQGHDSEPTIYLKLSANNNRLFITLPYPLPIDKTKTFELQAESDSTFFTAEGDFEIEFIPGNNNEFTIMGITAKRLI